jgi:shikimate kinase
MDLDEVIEQQSGRTIPEIFATDGEAVFRQMELAALQNIVHTAMPKCSGGPLPQQSCGTLPLPGGGKMPPTHKRHTPILSPTLILSLGGGTVMTPECAALVQENTMCIYLRTSVDTLVARLADEAAGRPLLSAGNVIPNGAEESTSHAMHLRSRIESLMSSRASVYERTADIVIDTDNNTIDSVAQTLAKVVSANR